MSFTSKNLQTTRRGGLSVLKGATLFFLGMSCVMFLTRAYFTITPEATNARQVIESIFLSQGGDPSADTGISLDGANGNAYFAGNVGIGTGTPSTYKLDVDGTGKFNGVCLGGDCRSTWPTGGTVVGGESIWSTGAADVAYYNLGNVGIGTDDPTEKFQVSSYAQIGDDSSSDTGGNFLRIHSTYVPGFVIQGQAPIPAYYKNPNIQLNRKSGQVQGDNKNRKIENNGTLKFDYATGSYDYDTKLSLSSTGLMTLDGNIRLQTGGYIRSASNANQLYLDYNGRVGIGTGTPQAKFHITKPVWGDGLNQYLIKASLDDSSDNRFWVHDGGDTYIHGWLGIGINPLATQGNTQEHALLVNGTSYLSGNVGIGTGTPQAKLHVAGTGQFNDGIIVGNNNEYNTKISNGYLQIERECEDLGLGGDCSQRPYGIYLHNDSGLGGIDETLTIEGGAIEASKYLWLKSILESRFYVSGNIVQTNTPLGVGIGSYFSPEASLHVKTNGTTGRVALFEAGGSTAGQLEINGGETSQMVIRTMKPGTDLTFATHLTGAGTYNANQLYLKNDGNVGIGKSPSAKLDVNGGIKAIKKTLDPCTDSSNYPEGTMFYVRSHEVLGATFPSMYCFCDEVGTARPINGKLIIGTAGGAITVSSDVCFAP